MYLLSSEMTTNEQIDFLQGSIEHNECEQSTWRLEQVVFARSERKCVTLHPRESDHNIEDTKYANENVLALMCSERMSTKFSLRRNWEVDFVRFLLGYTTFEEEQSFNTLTMDHYKEDYKEDWKGHDSCVEAWNKMEGHCRQEGSNPSGESFGCSSSHLQSIDPSRSWPYFCCNDQWE